MAIADYSQAIDLDPEYALAYNNRGIVYNNQGKHELAIIDHTQAINLNPEDAQAYYIQNTEYTYYIQNTEYRIQRNCLR